MQTAKKG